MAIPLLKTKLYIPPVRPGLVSRPRLIERLEESLRLGCKLTLLSAPAGFGKTTLVSEWVAAQGRLVAWLSLDESDNDLTRFLTYLIAALQAAVQAVEANIGKGVLSALRSTQPPPVEGILTTLINEVAAIPDRFALVFDDYHLIEAQSIHDALTFLLRRLPPQMHLIIATREDPPLPLARLRARGQLTELRVTDLRFTSSETAEFLNQVMDLNLSAEDIAALETRTEGWIAGLQLASLALQGPSTQGRKDIASFIQAFTGSHRFVLDYLVEEVLQQQSENVQTFLLQTAILDRLTGSLCDAVIDRAVTGQDNGQVTLEMLERANLFIVPLDDERRWYRYHRLFADLLRQRLYRSTASSTGDEGKGVAEYHIRASQWYEDNGMEVEAFHHAAAAHDIDRAARLMEGDWMPLPFRGAVVPVLNWLESLPTTVLDARPLLWVTYASTLLGAGQLSGVEQKLQAAETALQGVELDDKTQDLVGRIAAIRATLAVNQYQVETIIAQSRRALEYLHPDNLAFRTSTIWKLGYAYQLQGDRAAASQAYTEAMSIGQASGNVLFTVSAMLGLGSLQEADNQLYLAAESYQRALHLFGDQPLPALACVAHLGLARIFYEWNDLDAAQQHRQQSVQLVRQTEGNDTFAACELFLARLKLAEGDVAGAAAVLTEADQFVRQHNLVNRMLEVAAAQVLTLLRQGNLAAAADLAENHELPISRARVHLAQGDTGKALALLEPLRRQMEAKDWKDERLKVMGLQAIALHAHGEKEEAVQLLGDALALAEPGGFIRLFVDEGLPMAHLLSEAVACRMMPDYTVKLLAAFEADERKSAISSPAQPLVEPLSPRELEVLGLIAQGLSNREIGERLFLALATVKGHNRRIYGKLGVKNRTQAVNKARSLNILPAQ